MAPHRASPSFSAGQPGVPTLPTHFVSLPHPPHLPPPLHGCAGQEKPDFVSFQELCAGSTDFDSDQARVARVAARKARALGQNPGAALLQQAGQGGRAGAPAAATGSGRGAAANAIEARRSSSGSSSSTRDYGLQGRQQAEVEGRLREVTSASPAGMPAKHPQVGWGSAGSSSSGGTLLRNPGGLGVAAEQEVVVPAEQDWADSFTSRRRLGYVHSSLRGGQLQPGASQEGDDGEGGMGSTSSPSPPSRLPAAATAERGGGVGSSRLPPRAMVSDEPEAGPAADVEGGGGSVSDTEMASSSSRQQPPSSTPANIAKSRFFSQAGQARPADPDVQLGTTCGGGGGPAKAASTSSTPTPTPTGVRQAVLHAVAAQDGKEVVVPPTSVPRPAIPSLPLQSTSEADVGDGARGQGSSAAEGGAGEAGGSSRSRIVGGPEVPAEFMKLMRRPVKRM